eukprot:364687-Chlamydomonas_euryale.AAC.3
MKYACLLQHHTAQPRMCRTRIQIGGLGSQRVSTIHGVRAGTCRVRAVTSQSESRRFTEYEQPLDAPATQRDQQKCGTMRKWQMVQRPGCSHARHTQPLALVEHKHVEGSKQAEPHARDCGEPAPRTSVSLSTFPRSSVTLACFGGAAGRGWGTMSRSLCSLLHMTWSV